MSEPEPCVADITITLEFDAEALAKFVDEFGTNANTTLCEFITQSFSVGTGANVPCCLTPPHDELRTHVEIVADGLGFKLTEQQLEDIVDHMVDRTTDLITDYLQDHAAEFDEGEDLD